MIRRDMWPSGRDIEIGDGLHLHTVEAGTGPLVVLCHGFPELGYSWRHQLAPLVEAGYRVAIPDMLGFGPSSQPAEIPAYDAANTAGGCWRSSTRSASPRRRSSATTGARRGLASRARRARACPRSSA